MKLNNSILSKLSESKKMPDKYKDLVSKIEDLGWGVSVVDYSNGDYLCFQKYSNAGEDFFFEVPMGTEQDLLKDVKEYAENFDPIEHAQEMLGAPGAPDLRALLSDADDIDKDLKELSKVLEKNIKLDSLNEGIRDFRYSEEDIDVLRDLLHLEGSQSGGLIHFDRVPLENLRQVVDKRLAWDGDRQNDGRSIREILKLGEETLPDASITVGGYVVLPPREDQRVSVDSVMVDLSNCRVDNAEEIVKEFAENADEFDEENSEYYMWWD